MDYSKGKIYVLRELESSEIFYVGSTCATLYSRRYGHKKGPTRESSAHWPVYQHTAMLGDDGWYIELYEDFPCSGIEALRKREGEVIRELKKAGCVLKNVKVAGRTMSELRKEEPERVAATKKREYEKNKEKYLAYQKAYAAEHAEKVREYQREYYQKNAEAVKASNKSYRLANQEKIKELKQQKETCECGAEYTVSNRGRHRLSKGHLLFRLSNEVLSFDEYDDLYKQFAKACEFTSQRSKEVSSYYQKNKEKVMARMKQKVECEICGKTLTKGNLLKHKKTQHK